MAEETYAFPRSHRLSKREEYARVFEARVREGRGPVMMYARPNGLGHPRLGISLGRAVGNAVRRNRIKRLLREAFRMHQHDLPVGYDFVVTVRPHEPMILAEYQKTITALMLRLHAEWERRGRSMGGVE